MIKRLLSYFYVYLCFLSITSALHFQPILFSLRSNPGCPNLRTTSGIISILVTHNSLPVAIEIEFCSFVNICSQWKLPGEILNQAGLKILFWP